MANVAYMMIYSKNLNYHLSKPWFTTSIDSTNSMCCSTPISCFSFKNPIFGTKCDIQNITKKTKSEVMNELCEIKDLQPIVNLNGNGNVNVNDNIIDDNSILYNEMQPTIKENYNDCLHYIYDFICEQKNKNEQNIHIKYCSKCGKCYKRFHYVVYKWWNIPYHSELEKDVYG